MVSVRTLVRVLVSLSAATTTVAFLPIDGAASRTNTQGIALGRETSPRISRIDAYRSPILKIRQTESLSTRLGVSNLAETSQSSGLESKAPLALDPVTEATEELVEFSTQQQIINAVFLAATFGYALYTILNIDQGLTRGWTGSEIAMRIPLDNWGAYESYLANKPIMTKTLINVIIYLLGDWLSQTAFQGKNVLHFDISRTLRNGFIGLCFGPLVHQYYQFSDTILPPEDGLATRLQKILMDQTLYLTVKCSIYISAVGLLGGDDWDTVKGTVKEKIGGVVITAWKFWPLVHCITYGLIPARHRVLWVNSVDLVWNAILATMSQKDVPEEESAVAQSASLEAGSLTEEAETANEGILKPVLVLDNKWVEDKTGEVVDMILPNNNNNLSTNTTTCPDAALGTA